MDHFYDHRQAAKKLQELVDTRNKVQQGKGNVIQCQSLNVEECHIAEFALPKCWRLALDSEDIPGTMDDITIQFQGILIATELPPISAPPNTSAMRRMRPHIRQAITITGLGLDFFNEVIQKIEQVYVMFSNAFPPNSMIHWQPGQYQNQATLDVHARYFTHKNILKGECTKPFEPFVDPDNILLRMQEDQYIHHDDNLVEYFGRHITKEGKSSFRKIDPSQLRVGDIVEVALSLACFEIREKKYIMIPILRAVTLFDQDIRNKADILRMRERYQDKPQVQIKRARAKIHEDSSEVTETQSRLSRMRMEE